MLVLTRGLGEKLIIGGNITIGVVSVKRGRVHLAFDAPKDVVILRGELVGPRRDPRLSNAENYRPTSTSRGS